MESKHCEKLYAWFSLKPYGRKEKIIIAAQGGAEVPLITMDRDVAEEAGVTIVTEIINMEPGTTCRLVEFSSPVELMSKP
jgi:hypothetical protein